MQSVKAYQIQAWVSGHVQGVGFRYKTRETAKEFEICGEVRNLMDGRVFLCAEGEEKEVVAFLSEVETRMRPFIRKVEKKATAVTRTYRDFSITCE